MLAIHSFCLQLTMEAVMIFTHDVAISHIFEEFFLREFYWKRYQFMTNG